MGSLYEEIAGSYDNAHNGAHNHDFYKDGVNIGTIISFSVETLVYTVRKTDGKIGYFRLKEGKVIELYQVEA